MATSAEDTRAKGSSSNGRGGETGAGERPPWKVEGERSPPPVPPVPTKGPARRQPSFWALLAILFLVNWLVSAWFLAPADRTDVTYTFFRDQVEAGKVAEITSTEDAIEGRFTEDVTYPPEGAPVRRFSTHRPSFADDDHREASALSLEG